MRLSIRALSQLTGVDRDSVTRLIQHLPSEPGPKNSRTYDPPTALRAILGGNTAGGGGGGAAGSLESARTEQALSAARLNKVREETLRKERMPVALFYALVETNLTSFRNTLCAAKGQTLSVAKINELLTNLNDNSRRDMQRAFGKPDASIAVSAR